MSISDYHITNQPGASFRADLNNILQSIATNNASASEPPITFAYMYWADTTSGLLKQRNASNNNWVSLLNLSDGKINAAQVPYLDASKITTGLLVAARIANLPASKITSGTLAVARIPDLPVSKITTLMDSLTPPGSVIAMASLAVPLGYLECNGAELSRDTYADLFAVISDVFGVGDGTTTFNIPDLRGEFIRGWDNARGVDAGRSMGSTQSDSARIEIPSRRGTKNSESWQSDWRSTTPPKCGAVL